MRESCEFLERLSNTSSRNKKLALLRENKTEEIKFLLETALHPMMKYGVADISEKKSQGTKIPSLNKIYNIREALVSRKIVGNEARKILTKYIQVEDEIVRKWLVRAFNKNLRAGISSSTVNKVYHKLIPEFPVGLCNAYDEHLFCLPEGNWTIEPKLDGLRCLAIIDKNGEITFVSRNNKPLYNTRILEEQLKKKNLKNYILDGELFGDDWNSSIETARSFKKEDGIENLTFYIFDAITMKEWTYRKTMTLIKRKARLKNSIGEDLKNIKLIGLNIIDSYSDAKKIYDNFLENGYEGAVLKNISSQYPFKRGSDWLKWKTMITVDLEIINYKEGTGRNVGKLGAFICDYKSNNVYVGSGYSDAQRKEFWKNKSEMIGKIIEVQAQEITKDNSLRFPVFKTLRFDKDLGD